jgi:DNA-binding NarL/FixJ family response regulator
MRTSVTRDEALVAIRENETTADSETAAAVVPLHPSREIAVALIEDNRLVRDGITSLLNRFPDIRVVAASDYSLVEGTSPRVVLLDLGLENGDSLRLARKVRKDFPDARVVVMDLLPAHEDLMEFIGVGVSGFIVKDATLEDVVGTIRSVAAGNDVLPARMTGTLFSEIARETVSNGGSEEAHDSVRMTPREREVIDLISEGLSNKAIGKRLHISVHTVKSHLRNIMEKLTLHSRLQIAAYAHDRDDAP